MITFSIQALQEEISQHQSQVDALTSMGHSMMDNCSPEDAVVVGNKLAQITSSFESLQRAAAARKRLLDDGLVRANEFSSAWNNAIGIVSEKSKELQNLASVGVDIDTVRTQLDEYKVSRVCKESIVCVRGSCLVDMRIATSSVSAVH